MYGYQKLLIPGIIAFHSSFAKLRLLSANNRGGKSTRGAWELVCYATGYHPIRKEHYPTPNICWAVALDRKNYGHIVQERLREWLPRGTIWREGSQCFQLPQEYGGSKIYIKSAEPGETKFAAEGVIAAWFDEGRADMEKPFMETLARLNPKWGGVNAFITMSPEDGVGGWTWPKFYDPNSTERYKDAEVFYFDIYECSTERGGHLTPKDIADFKAQFPEWKWPAKLFGRPGTMSSNPFFRPDYIDRMEARLDTPRRVRIQEDAAGNLKVEDDELGDIVMLRPPVPGRRYIMPADMGGGVSRDYTVASILDVEDRCEVAYFKSNTMDVETATVRKIVPLGRLYNRALAIPETNGEHGAMHLSCLRQRKYRPIYRRQTWSTVAKRYYDEYGWRTNDKGSRDMVHDAWSSALYGNEWTISKDALDEARIISEAEGRPDHPKGRHDDHFFTVGIGLAAISMKPQMGQRPKHVSMPVWGGMEDANQYAV